MPVNKVIFIFFLRNLEGVETKLISKCQDDLYQIYKEVRDNPKKKTIENITGRHKKFRTI